MCRYVLYSWVDKKNDGAKLMEPRVVCVWSVGPLREILQWCEPYMRKQQGHKQALWCDKHINVFGLPFVVWICFSCLLFDSRSKTWSWSLVSWTRPLQRSHMLFFTCCVWVLLKAPVLALPEACLILENVRRNIWDTTYGGFSTDLV
jgi:hypothetical protein